MHVVRRRSQPRSGPARAGLLLAALVTLVALGGCEGYRIRGRVVEGPYGSAEFVNESPMDERAVGIDGARITIFRDAGRLNEASVGTFRAEADGMIDIDLDSFGAGWMEETWRIEVVRPGFETVQQVTALPNKKQGKLLLVMMRPGRSVLPDPSLLEQYETFK